MYVCRNVHICVYVCMYIVLYVCMYIVLYMCVVCLQLVHKNKDVLSLSLSRRVKQVCMMDSLVHVWVAPPIEMQSSTCMQTFPPGSSHAPVFSLFVQ